VLSCRVRAPHLLSPCCPHASGRWLAEAPTFRFPHTPAACARRTPIFNSSSPCSGRHFLKRDGNSTCRLACA
jgi:hypothetical protein